MAIKLGTQTAGIMLVTSAADLSAVALLDTNPIDPVSRTWSISYFPGDLASAPAVTGPTNNPASFTPPAAGEWYVVRLVRTLALGIPETLELPICVPDASGTYALPPPGIPADVDPTKTIVNLNDNAKKAGWSGSVIGGVPGLDGAVRKALSNSSAAVIPASATNPGTQSAHQFTRTAGQSPSVKELGITVDGTTDDFAALQTAASGNASLSYPVGTCKIATTGAIGIPDQTHTFERGSKLHIQAGVTLTLRGIPVADKDQQIFELADATASIVLVDAKNVHPGWFGAAGNANYLHTDFKWYTDSSHTTEATDDSLTVRKTLDAIAGRSAAGLPTTAHITGQHYLKTPQETGIAPFTSKRFFVAQSSTTYNFDGGAFRLAAGLQTSDYAILHTNADVRDVTIKGFKFDGNAADTTSPSVDGSTQATSQRNAVICLAGAHSDNVTIEDFLIENHAGYIPIFISDFTSANKDQRATNVHVSGTFREIGNVVGLLDHISLYLTADVATINCLHYNDPANNAHSKDFGGAYQFQGSCITVAGALKNVPAIGLVCSFFGVASRAINFVGVVLDMVPVGIGIAQAVGLQLTDLSIVGVTGTMTNCSAGQLEGFLQCIGTNGSDLGVDGVLIDGCQIRYIHDARYADSQPTAIQFSTNIRNLTLGINSFEGWPSGGLVITPTTLTNPNNIPPTNVVTSDLKIWDVHLRGTRFKNCGSPNVNIGLDTSFVPIRRVTVRDCIFEKTERVLRISNATNASTIVVTTCDEVTGAAMVHGLADADPVTISGVLGNTNANRTGYAKVTSYSTSTFGLFSDAGLTTPVAGNAAYTGLGVVQVPKGAALTTAVQIAGRGDSIEVDPAANFFYNVTNPVLLLPAAGGAMTNAYAGAKTIYLDDGGVHPVSGLTLDSGRVTLGFDNGTSGAAIYNGANSNYALRATSTGVTLEFGGLVRLKAVASGVAINAATGPSTGDSALTLKAGTAPTTNPGSNEVSIYVDIADGILKARGSSGTITPLALP